MIHSAKTAAWRYAQLNDPANAATLSAIRYCARRARSSECRACASLKAGADVG